MRHRTVLAVALAVLAILPLGMLARADLAVVEAERPELTAPEASARLEPPVTPLHEPATLVIEVVMPRDLDVAWPGLRQRLDQTIGLFGEPRVTTEFLPDGRMRVITAYTLDALREDTYFVGPLRMVWGEPRQETMLPGFELQVRTLTDDERTALATLRPSVPAPMLPFGTAWYVYLLGGILLGAAAVIAAWWWRTRDKEDFYAPASLKPWQVAEDALRALRQKRYPEQGMHEPYFVELSAVLRTYIEARFHLHAPEQTTPEFLQDARGSGLLTDTQQAFLAEFLRQSDRVKFARLEPSVESMRTSMTQVQTFIDETIPRELEAETPPAEAAA